MDDNSLLLQNAAKKYFSLQNTAAGLSFEY